jgi:predicted dehydrogenase
MQEVDLVAVYDLDGLSQPAETVRRLNALSDLESGMADYVVVATPTPTHAEVASSLMRLGVPLLIEKPLAENSTRAMQIRDDLHRCGGTAVVGMIERFNGVAEEARRIVRAKQMGRLLKISTRRIGPPPGRDMGVGVLMDLGVHDLDLVRWITGEELVSPIAHLVSRAVSNHDDLAIVTGALSSGALFHTESSWVSPTKERSVELVFTLGTVSMNLLSGVAAVTEQVGREIEWEAVRDVFGPGRAKSLVYGVKTVEPLVAQHRAMCRAISTKDWSHLPGIGESIDLIRLIEGLYKRSGLRDGVT